MMMALKGTDRYNGMDQVRNTRFTVVCCPQNAHCLVVQYSYGGTNNRLISKNGVTRIHDQVGNITNNGTYGFNYDAANRMVAVTQGATSIASYSHNALGQRASKTRPNNANAHSTAYIYNPAGQLISETTYNNIGIKQETKHYVWLGTVPVAMLQTIKAGQPAANDEQVIYLHTDHLDTPRKATNQNQEIVWQWLSDAFGKTAANDNPDGDAIATVINLRFPGQYYDAETELHYNYFRDYDPGMGRYVQSDPIGVAGGLNTFGYVLGNPLAAVDYFGLSKTPGTGYWRPTPPVTGTPTQQRALDRYLKNTYRNHEQMKDLLGNAPDNTTVEDPRNACGGLTGCPLPEKMTKVCVCPDNQNNQNDQYQCPAPGSQHQIKPLAHEDPNCFCYWTRGTALTK